MGGVRFQMVPAQENAPPPGPEFTERVRAGLQQAAQSDAAKDAAKRFAEQQQRFRDGVTATAGCEGKSDDYLCTPGASWPVRATYSTYDPG